MASEEGGREERGGWQVRREVERVAREEGGRENGGGWQVRREVERRDS